MFKFKSPPPRPIFRLTPPPCLHSSPTPRNTPKPLLYVQIQLPLHVTHPSPSTCSNSSNPPPPNPTPCLHSSHSTYTPKSHLIFTVYICLKHRNLHTGPVRQVGVQPTLCSGNRRDSPVLRMSRLTNWLTRRVTYALIIESQKKFQF